MAIRDESGLIGLHAFSSDGAKLGKIRDVIQAGGKSYLVIRRFLSKDLIVPADGARKSGDIRVEVNFKNIYIDHGPEHARGDEPSPAELHDVDDYYRRAA